MDLQDLYPDLILEEAKHPQNQGVLETADIIVTEKVASCGDTATICLSLDGEKISKMMWQGDGCAISRAGLSLLSVAVENQPVKTVLAWTIEDVLPLLHMEQIAPGREQCLLLGLRALQRALKQRSPGQSA